MSQTAKIAGLILFAFVIYITVRGQLGNYIAVFVGKPGGSSTTSQTSTTSSNPLAGVLSLTGITGMLNSVIGG